MKRMFFLSLSVFLFYLAGMYRYPALMILAVGQLLMALYLKIQAHVCSKRVRAGFCRKMATAVKGEPVSCGLSVGNQGKLPVGRLRFSIKYGYGDRKKKKHLYGNAGDKNNFSIRPLYCGVAELCLEKIRVYDYFFLSSVERKISDRMRIMVFPREREMKVCFSDAGKAGEPEDCVGVDFGQPGNGQIRQIREYREGDSLKSIHWKLSARTDKLLIREYEGEAKGRTELFLDLEGYGEASLREKDAFYELLSALVLGLLRSRDSVFVWWRGEAVGEGGMDVTECSQCRELLAELYFILDRDMPVERSPKRAGRQEKKQGIGERLSLDLQLRLSAGGREVFRFSRENLEMELQEIQRIGITE